jgi:hypothetical protein
MVLPADIRSTLYLVSTLGFSVRQKSQRKESVIFSYDGQSILYAIIKMLHPRFRARLLEEGINERFLSVTKLMTIRIMFIIFRRVCINNEKPLLAVVSICTSVSPHLSVELPLDGFS